ncbi:hypothetical protein O3P69_012403, partial [Scylla paramamosain]
VFSDRCAMASGLYKRLWAAHRTVNIRTHTTSPLLLDPHASFSHGYVLAYTNATQAFLDQASKGGMMESTHWLLLLTPSSMPAFLVHALTLNIFINSDLLYASYNTCPSLIKVKGIYRVGPRSGVVEEAAGNWTPTKGFSLVNSTNRLERTSDFQGYHMKGVFEFMSTYLGGGNITGFVGDIVTALRDAHNFSLISSSQQLEILKIHAI